MIGRLLYGIGMFQQVYSFFEDRAIFGNYLLSSELRYANIANFIWNRWQGKK
jgi:hypothetical protein